MLNQNQFSIRVLKDSLVFSAAHFITYSGDVCERLHGHNWRVEAAVEGPLDRNGYVFDFIALRDSLQCIVNDLDHRMLLPDRHPRILVAVSADGREVEVTFEDRRWVFPAGDCRILPMFNTTAELIAQWIAEALIPTLRAAGLESSAVLCVRVEENFGQWAECRLAVADSR